MKQHDAVKVTRGLAAMVFSQLVTVPLSMLVTSVLARKLGPLDFGAMYLATTAAKLAFLFVEWGQSNSMAGAVARDRSVAPRLLGTSVALKLVFGTIALGVLIGVGRLLGYTPEAKLAVIFIAVQATLGTCIGSGQAVLRGYERQDIVSGLGLYGNLLESGSVLTLALLGTGLAGVLWGGVIGKAMGIIPLVILLRRFKIGRPVVRREAVGELLHLGFAFLMFDLVLALQPYIDAMVLNRNAPAEVMGWHAATQRLTGVLIFPSSALGIAMYPTLARLSRESPAEHVAMMRDGLRLMVLGSVPAAVGVIVFARPVIHALYGSTGFEGAILNLQVLSPWIALVYFSILLGTMLVASGQVAKWTMVQAICIVVSVVANPFLVRYFQATLQNGAIGVSVGAVSSEIAMVSLGFAMAEKGMVGKRFLVTAGQALLAGGAMALVGRALADRPAVGIALALAAYAAVLTAVGGLRLSDFKQVVDLLRAKRGAA